MSSPRRPTLRLLTLNVNGLRHAGKRATLFRMLIEGGWDVVVLQETHHASSAEGIGWARDGGGATHTWEGLSEWHHRTSHSGGVAVLFRAGLAVAQVRRAGADAAGRILRVDFTFESELFSVVSVYAPVQGSTSPSQAHFFLQDLAPLLPSDRKVLLGGDFNCVAGPEDVVGPYVGHSRFEGHSEGLAHVESAHDLVDAWRSLHPGRAGFTHTGTAGTSSARLDRWLFSRDLLQGLVSAQVVLGLPGDHLGVAASVCLPGGVLRGPGVWSLPVVLLDDEDFLSLITSRVRSFWVSHPLGPVLTRADRWDLLKVYVRDLSEQYMFERNGRRRRQEASLRKVAEAALAAYVARPTDQAALATWQAAHAAVQAFQAERSRAAALRAGVVWQLYAEQPTYWFHNLARERGRDNTLHVLQVPGEAEPVSLSSLDGRDRVGGALRD